MTDRPDENAVPPEEESQPSSGESKNPWFVPDNALNDEQLEALNAGDLPELNTNLMLGNDPDPASGWRKPDSATAAEVVEEEPAEQEDEADVISNIQPATATTADLLAGLEAEAPPQPLTDSEAIRAVPEAPVAFGHGDFASAPAGPIDEPEEFGLGGLRDEVPAGLSPDQVGVKEAPVAPEVPARGLGGVSGGSSVSQETRDLSDTGAYGGQQTPMPTGTSAMPASGAPMSPQPNPEVEKFRAVEQQVATLRQQYAQGQITRSQLETQLREHVVMDEQGRWWTIGVDSNRWYRYDGREWIPDTPPQTGSIAAIGNTDSVQGNYVRTETNVPQPTPGPQGQVPQIELDDYGMPLPQQVPQEDPGATMVNLRSATSQHDEQTWAPSQSAQTLASDDVIPSPGPAGETMPSAAYQEPEATMVSGTPQPADAGYEYNYGESQEPAIEEPAKKKDELQPDYSAAYSRSLDRSDMVRYAVWGGMGFVVVGLGMTLCILLGMVGYYFSVVNQYQDRIDALGQQASTFQTTRIYDVNGNVIAEYNDPNQGARTEVPLEEISPFLIHATIATEDETYYDNPGFNVFAILRAIYTNLNSQGPQSGASTITQQLVRALLLDEDFATQVSSERKITEIILAAEISRKYSKDEILEIYLNEIYYGNLAYGAEAASQTYFGKSVSDLNVYEAALLAGIPQAPAVWDPVRNRQETIGRMETVLRLMTEANGNGCIQMEHTDASIWNYDLSAPFCITSEFLNPDISPDRALERLSIDTNIFESPARNIQHAHFVNWIWDELEAQFDTSEIYTRGFNVYTTLDPTLQQTAQDAVVNQINTTPYNVNNGSVVVMDPRDGRVLAMVGSADFNNEEIDGQVNVAFSPQQPGSSIKPLVYLTAFEGNANGEYYTPATVLWDTQTCWGNSYCPPNYDGEFRGPLTIRRALANSLNVPAVKTMDFVTPAYFEQRAEELGLTFPITTPSEAGLPAALGAVEIRLFDLVATYSAFANQGERYQPFGILRVETADGEVVYEHTPTQEGLPINPAHAYLINTILTDTQTRAEEFGFDPRLTVDGYQVSVKTGTTGTSTDTFDALTIGWTPQVVVGVWMGNTDNSGTGGATGFAVAAPVWDRVITTALQGQESIPFSPPQQVVDGIPQNLVQQITVCNVSGTQLPASGSCGVGESYTEYFFVNQPPPTSDGGFVETTLVDPFTNLRANQFCSDYAEEKTFLNIDDGTAWEWFKTAAGQNWLNRYGIDPNLPQAPEGECQADQTRPVVLISSPVEGQTLDTLIPVSGTATVPNFTYYELQYASASNPGNFVTIEQHNIQQSGDAQFLGQWDVSAIPNGQYILRLIAVSNTGAQAEFSRNVNIFHAVPTAPIQPTAIPGTTPFAPTQTPAEGEAIPQAG